jgi:predicted esterase
MFRVLIISTCFFLSSIGASAEDWRAQFGALVKTPAGSETDSLIARIVSAGPDWREVMDQIESLIFSDTIKGRELLDSAVCIDGVARPYVVYVPSGYDPRTPTPLLVHLHGLVGRPIIEPDPHTYVGNNAIMAEAEKRGWLVLFPFGQKGATWWDEVGMTNIMTQVRTTKANFNIDDNRVYLSGLSDGASAAFLFAMIRPNDFAAFVALNGSMGVGSEDGGFSTYAPNLANSYMYVTTADRDRYYPTAQMERTISMAEKAGANISYRRLKGEHTSSIVETEYPTIFDYLEQHPRNPFPNAIVWETATPEFGLCKWLEIDEITIDEPAPWYIDYNVALIDSTISIGFIPYDTFPGPGVMVASISDGDCVARRIGLEPGDIILNANGIPVDSLADLGKVRATLKRGSEVTLTVRRGQSEIMLSGRVPPPRNYFVFKRDKPSAVAKAAYKDNRFDIQGSRVGAFRILISPEMVNLQKNVVVVFDGEVIFDRKVAPDIGYMLRNYLAGRDRKSVFVNEVSLRPTR